MVWDRGVLKLRLSGPSGQAGRFLVAAYFRPMMPGLIKPVRSPQATRRRRLSPITAAPMREAPTGNMTALGASGNPLPTLTAGTRATPRKASSVAAVARGVVTDPEADPPTPVESVALKSAPPPVAPPPPAVAKRVAVLPETEAARPVRVSPLGTATEIEPSATQVPPDRPNFKIDGAVLLPSATYNVLGIDPAPNATSAKA